MNGFFLAEVRLTIPAHDPARSRAGGIKECSRTELSRAIPPGTLAYVQKFKETQYWMAFFRSGMVIKLDPGAARRHLRTIRDDHGRPVRDNSGTGARLCQVQNQRAGDRPGYRGPSAIDARYRDMDILRHTQT